ncbi:MAG TPA: hypothetical protein VGP47_11135 [Parachlamydiaceae bacterium]|nr:hypothetical protein [Parachlamydiaceae bacterium]
MINTDRVIFSFVANTVHYDDEYDKSTFALGYTVTDFSGNELQHGYLTCPTETCEGILRDKKSVKARLIPYNDDDIRCNKLRNLTIKIFNIWQNSTHQYREVFAITDLLHRWGGIYPLYEAAKTLEIADISKSDYPRKLCEYPEGEPLKDARYLARLYLLATNKLNNTYITTIQKPATNDLRKF